MGRDTGRSASGIASVHTEETNERKHGRGTLPQHRLHFRSARVRFWLIDVLKRSGDERLQRRSVRLDYCGAFPTIHQGSTGPASLRYNLCRDRLCPTCQRVRGVRLRLKLLAVVALADAPKFVTLTIKHREAPLGDEIDRLFSAFRRLRKSPAWAKRVSGGIYVLEVKRNPNTQRWHPHLHCLVDSSYLPQNQLSAAWHSATGDSTIVDIRAVHSQAEAAGYVASYATKGDDLTKWTAAAIIEYAQAMHGRRLMHTFGTLHKSKTIDTESEDPAPTDERRIATTTHLLHRADVGDYDARYCVAVLSAIDPKWATAFGVGGPERVLVPAPPSVEEVDRALAWARCVDRRPWHAPLHPSPQPPAPHPSVGGLF